MRSFLTASARRSNSTALSRYWSAREVISPVSFLNPVWAAAARRSGQPRHSGRPAQLSASTPLPNSQTEPEDEGSGWLRLYSVVLGPPCGTPGNRTTEIPAIGSVRGQLFARARCRDVGPDRYTATKLRGCRVSNPKGSQGRLTLIRGKIQIQCAASGFQNSAEQTKKHDLWNHSGHIRTKGDRR